MKFKDAMRNMRELQLMTKGLLLSNIILGAGFVWALATISGERERIVMALGISDHVGLGRAVVAEAGVGERVQCLLGDVDAHMRAFRCLRSAFHFGWYCRNALSVLIGSQKSPSGRSSCHH